MLLRFFHCFYDIEYCSTICLKGYKIKWKVEFRTKKNLVELVKTNTTRIFRFRIIPISHPKDFERKLSQDTTNFFFF